MDEYETKALQLLVFQYVNLNVLPQYMIGCKI